MAVVSLCSTCDGPLLGQIFLLVSLVLRDLVEVGFVGIVEDFLSHAASARSGPVMDSVAFVLLAWGLFLWPAERFLRLREFDVFVLRAARPV